MDNLSNPRMPLSLKVKWFVRGVLVGIALTLALQFVL